MYSSRYKLTVSKGIAINLRVNLTAFSVTVKVDETDRPSYKWAFDTECTSDSLQFKAVTIVIYTCSLSLSNCDTALAASSVNLRELIS
jgi:hypothetical protein